MNFFLWKFYLKQREINKTYEEAYVGNFLVNMVYISCNLKSQSKIKKIKKYLCKNFWPNYFLLFYYVVLSLMSIFLSYDGIFQYVWS